MTLDEQNIQSVIGLVTKRYPNWSEFADPRFVKDEVGYKHAAIDQARTLLLSFQ